MLKTRANQLAILVFLAAVFGGGGVAYGLTNLLVQLAAFGLLALNYGAVRDFFTSAPRLLVILVTASMALPLLQLLPLPPSLWSGLPGRDLVQESLVATGGALWFPVSVNPARTFVAFIGLIAPFTVIILGCRMKAGEIYRMVPAIILIGVVNVAIGVPQVLGIGGFGSLYVENAMPGVLFGFFANRNSAGVFLVCCLLLLASLPAARVTSVTGLTKLAAAILITLGVVLTQSRTSIVLLGLPLALAALRAASSRQTAHMSGPTAAVRVVVLGAIAAVASASMLPLAGDTRIGTVLARFDAREDPRTLIWEDASFTAKRYWPVGAGMATFDEVFQADESLENISLRRAGRAHNDYLEIAIEAGAVGLALVAAWALWLAFASWQAISTAQRWPALAGTGILLAIALQSALDYPLRNQTMLCLAAFAIVLVTPPGRTGVRVIMAGDDKP